ncbi:Ribosomal RNA small subunit methyltransferase B [Nitrospira sp. KM1]|nr:Ribosomal RNA small subunit methyltransferase B [Nitrospira sp. KM1]
MMELTYGVLRRQGTIDWRLTPVLDKPMRRLPVMVQMLLRMATYQLLFLDRIPPSAAVNESVRLAKAATKTLGRDWSGFVNAVLRSLIREPVPPWPSVDDDPTAALAVRYSVPEWLSRRWIDRLGIRAAEASCEQAGTIPPVTIRVNRLRTTRDEFLGRLIEAGVNAISTIVSPWGIVLKDCGAIRSLPGFEEGMFYVEDEGAQMIPLVLDPRPGEAVLDACAAPGGKATHLAEIMSDNGLIYAVDRHKARVDLLKANCRRLGINSVMPVVGDARRQCEWSVTEDDRGDARLPATFDRILVDAPCSGLGVLRRHPESKWRKQDSSFERHQLLQLEILRSAAVSLRPGGTLVYSTCSTEPDENEIVIEKFLSTHGGFRRESAAPWLPAIARDHFLTPGGAYSTEGNLYSMDVFFAARLRKRLA